MRIRYNLNMKKRPITLIFIITSELLSQPAFSVMTPSDPDYTKQWGLKNIGQQLPGNSDDEAIRGIEGIDIQIEKAWTYQKGSHSTIVAVIDSGIDFKQKDFEGKLWVNQAEKQGKVGHDDDGNGYVDDIHGVNLIKPGQPPSDGHGHGTHVASVIGANANNNLGIAGINWNVRIMPIKYLDDQLYALTDQAPEAIRYAVNNGAQIINCSWGSHLPSEELQKALDYAEAKGVLIIASAGNDAKNLDLYRSDDENQEGFFPALSSNANIISVAAMNPIGELISISNFGEHTVDLAAPGWGIAAWTLRGVEFWRGTSMAAPFVTGVAALLKSQNPNWSSLDIKKRLLDSVRPLRSLRHSLRSGGFLDAGSALSGSINPPDPNDPENWTAQEFHLESQHPIIKGFQFEKEFYVENANWIALKILRSSVFSSDHFEIIDHEGNSLNLTGLKINEFTANFKGPTFTIRARISSDQQFYGFKFSELRFKN